MRVTAFLLAVLAASTAAAQGHWYFDADWYHASEATIQQAIADSGRAGRDLRAAGRIVGDMRRTADEIDRIQAAALDVLRQVDQLKHAIVWISVGGAAGSGTVVWSDGREAIVTSAHHVVSGSGSCNVTWLDGARQRGKIISRSKYADLVAIRVPVPSETTIGVIPVAATDPQRGETIHLLGYGGSGKIRLQHDTTRCVGTSDTFGRIMQASPIVTISGDSGGAFLNSRLQLCGVVQGYSERTCHGPRASEIVRFLSVVAPEAVDAQRRIIGYQGQPGYGGGGGCQPYPCPVPDPVRPQGGCDCEPGKQGPAGPAGPQGPAGEPGKVTDEQVKQIIETLWLRIVENQDRFRGPPGERGPAGADGTPGKDGSELVVTDELIREIQGKLDPIRVYWEDPKTGNPLTPAVDARLGHTLPLQLLEQ